MNQRYHMPVDTECPEVRAYRDCLLNDPMTHAMGAPVDEILEAWENKHRQTCERCREYGLANIEVR